MADRDRRALHPLHAILLSFPLALFASAVVTDIVYLNTAEMLWSHFSAWLIAGGLVVGALVLLWAIVAFVRARRRTGGSGRPLAYLLLLAAMWGIGFVNILLHSRDAWASVMSTGLTLSAITALLALIAAWLAYAGTGRGEMR